MAIRKHSLNGKSMSEESKDALKNEKANEYLKSLFSQVTMDLPTIEDLEFLKSIEHEKGYYTDLCKITACNEDIKYYFLRDDDDKENIHYGPNNSTIDLVNKGKINNNKYSRRDFAIRPVLDFSNCPELFDIIIKRQRIKVNNDNEYGIVELGKYPQMVDTWYSIISNIKAIRKNKKLLSYTFDKVLPTYLSSDFKPLNLTVYKYNGLYSDHDYTIMEIRNLSSFYDKITHNLNEYSLGVGSSKKTFEEGRMVTVEVDSINWIVDSERKRLIAEKCLVSGIQFMRYNHLNDKEESVDFSKSNVRWYMEKYMKEQMFQYTKSKDLGVTDLLYDLALEEEMNKHEEELEEEAIKKKELERKEGKQEEVKEIKEENKPEEKKVNTKKQEIVSILEEIRDYKQYYLGKEDINNKIKKLYNEYLKKLNGLTEEVDLGLYIGTKDPRNYYKDLINELTKILDKLKLNSIKIKDSLDMKNILEECRKETIDIDKDILCKKVNDLNNTILSFDTSISIKNKLIKELDNILSNYISRIDGYVEKYKNNVNSETKTIDELREEFNKDFVPFENKISKLSLHYNILDILKECRKDEINATKDEICDTVYKIKNVSIAFINDIDLKKELTQELNEIIDQNILNIEKNIDEDNIKDDINEEKLRYDIAKSLTLFLVKLNRYVTNQEVVNDIIKEVEEMINNHFKESKIKVAKLYLDELNETISSIKEIGNVKDLQELKQLIKYDFDITKDISDVIDKLREYINAAQIFKIKIIQRNNRIKDIQEYKEEIDIESTLNGNTK